LPTMISTCLVFPKHKHPMTCPGRVTEKPLFQPFPIANHPSPGAFYSVLTWTCMHRALPIPRLNVHSHPVDRVPSCIHRIDGNTALHRDIYPSVSLQIQKNFAKSKWRVSCALQGLVGCSGTQEEGQGRSWWKASLGACHQAILLLVSSLK
jgi:hypothetical protein